MTQVVNCIVVVIYLLPWPLPVGESDLPACGPPASVSVHLAGSVHKSRGDSVVRMWVQLKQMVCVSCRGGIVALNVIWRRLCVSVI